MRDSVKYCCFLLEAEVTDSALLALSKEILADKVTRGHCSQPDFSPEIYHTQIAAQNHRPQPHYSPERYYTTTNLPHTLVTVAVERLKCICSSGISLSKKLYPFSREVSYICAMSAFLLKTFESVNVEF